MKVVILALCIAFACAIPTPKDAGFCVDGKCKIENNCKCSSLHNPIDKTKSPQLIAFTVSESIVETTFENYIKPLFYDKYNPDGRHIGATFFVNHEYTDYELVQDLWLQGFEIGVHSITKNYSQEYWRHASEQDLVEEFDGMKTILSKFAKIPKSDIVGARTPQLQLEGETSINAYVKSGIIYDNSWPTFNFEHYFPYTLDYKSDQNCLAAANCPKESNPGFWIVPITDIKGLDRVECNSLATCNVTGSAQEIADWLVGEINRERNRAKAPLVLRLDSYWFDFTKNAFEGFARALDQLGKMEDVFLVSTKQIYDWIKDPKPLGEFVTEEYDRDATCKAVDCVYENDKGSERHMKSCVKCPKVYPWKGNPLGAKDQNFNNFLN